MFERRDIEAFVRDSIVPLEQHALRHGFVGEITRTLDGLRADVRARGWWAPQVSRNHGGAGLSLVEYGHLSELLGYSPLGHYVFGAQAPDAGNIEILGEFGTFDQQERWLHPPRRRNNSLVFRND
jgi:acyl-CoA dehydrogenase